MTTLEKAKLAKQFLEDKKGQNVRILHIGDLTTIGDYFVIAHGSNDSQVRALADNVEEQFTKLGIEPKRVETDSASHWILMDYSDIIVHVFYKDTREFYALEKLWADAPEIKD